MIFARLKDTLFLRCHPERSEGPALIVDRHAVGPLKHAVGLSGVDAGPPLRQCREGGTSESSPPREWRGSLDDANKSRQGRQNDADYLTTVDDANNLYTGYCAVSRHFTNSEIKVDDKIA